MALEDLIQTYTWARYSKKIAEKVSRPVNSGFFTQADATERGMRLAHGKAGLVIDGNAACLFFLVDESDGMIVDAKFQVFGQSALIAAADAACDLLVGKNYEQARRISAELIDKELRDKSDLAAFPEETWAHLNLVVDAIEDAIHLCIDIPLPHSYNTPLPKDHAGSLSGGYPGWAEFSKEKKLSILEHLFSEEIRPYIELDEGGIEILDFIGDRELIISYKGACTSCFSSIGATLSTIQQIVQDKIHSEIVVVPNMDDLKF